MCRRRHHRIPTALHACIIHRLQIQIALKEPPMSADETTRRKFLAASATGVSATFVAANWDIAHAADASRPTARRPCSSPPARLRMWKRSPNRSSRRPTRPAPRKPGSCTSSTLRWCPSPRSSQGVYTKGLADLNGRCGGQCGGILCLADARPAGPGADLDRKDPVLPGGEKPHDHGRCSRAPSMAATTRRPAGRWSDFDDSLNFQPPFGYYDRT